MMREIRMKVPEDVAAAAEVAAERLGLTVAAYTRMALIKQMEEHKIRIYQPRVD